MDFISSLPKVIKRNLSEERNTIDNWIFQRDQHFKRLAFWIGSQFAYISVLSVENNTFQGTLLENTFDGEVDFCNLYTIVRRAILWQVCERTAHEESEATLHTSQLCSPGVALQAHKPLSQATCQESHEEHATAPASEPHGFACHMFFS
ncbi:uncharacterized protein LOC115900451 [Rhinopithecus roxellana]|uniref:uncharacterized protein LOC115900451 n=1 Tax=Rhinopithecus roxellana TaxID=61622 RepID=UPI0012377C49|nr:uncharacterized protein LOC115900451 [Rhinopithecus roxellana]